MAISWMLGYAKLGPGGLKTAQQDDPSRTPAPGRVGSLTLEGEGSSLLARVVGSAPVPPSEGVEDGSEARRLSEELNR